MFCLCSFTSFIISCFTFSSNHLDFIFLNDLRECSNFINNINFFSPYFLFVSSSVSLIGVLKFSKYRSFVSVSRIYSLGFILVDVIVNGLADSLLLVYRYAMDFCMLILCPTTLLSLFLILFHDVFRGFFGYSILSSAEKDCFTVSFSFSIWMSTISFS